MSFIKNIIYSILSVQEKLLSKRLEKTLGVKHYSKRRRHYDNGCLLSLDTLADSEKNKMEEELSLILKSSNYDPIQILEYIKKHNTEVYYINDPVSLHSIGENEGFIYPQKWAKALYLSLLTKKAFSLKTDAMFVLTRGEINTYYFVYHLYNWYAFTHGFFGLDYESQKLLNKYLYSANDDELKNLQLAEIYKLKDAIKQDKSAIEFVFKLCQQIESSKKALEKLQQDGASI